MNKWIVFAVAGLLSCSVAVADDWRRDGKDAAA